MENEHVGNTYNAVEWPPIDKFSARTTNADKVASVRGAKRLICSP